MLLYRSILRPLLFEMPADRAYALAHEVLRLEALWRLASVFPALAMMFAGVRLSSPVGLAASFDENAELTAALAHFGFGFLCVGLIMPTTRAGNPFPRLVRLVQCRSLIDSMGVASKGLEHALARLLIRPVRRVPIFANVGGFSAESIANGVFAALPYVAAVEISLMCPNVLGPGEYFDEIGMLRGVLDGVGRQASSVVVRVPKDTTLASDRFEELVEICVQAGVGGLKVGGGYPVSEPALGTGRGTMHGRAVANVMRAASFAKGRIPIKGNGGVSSAADVIAMKKAGATCVDLLSAMVFEGWTVARDINRELAKADGSIGAWVSQERIVQS
jgi:dihydroorotate dehydrogenase